MLCELTSTLFKFFLEIKITYLHVCFYLFIKSQNGPGLKGLLNVI